ncbi:MAG TPA: hypothetical protein VGK58_14080 [Lacipirellulaceae bacterium]
MGAQFPIEESNRRRAGSDDSIDGEFASTPTWQFSVRTLLIVTALVSVCLAVGVHYAGFMFALVVIGLIQVATLLSADWLIRPQNRRALAFVTAGSWIVLGSGLLIVGAREILLRVGINSGIAGWIFACSMVMIGIYCYYIAAKRWRRLTSRSFAEYAGRIGFYAEAASKRYNSEMDDPNRQIEHRSKLVDQGKDDDLRSTTIEERWSMMWQLAVDAWAMKGVNVAEQEFQRDVERLERLGR